MAAAQNHVMTTLMVCGASPAEIGVFTAQDRWVQLANLAQLMPKDILTLAMRLERCNVTGGRIHLPMLVMRNIQALVYWCGEQERQNPGGAINLADFMAVVLATPREKMTAKEEGKSDHPSIKPDKFDLKHWKHFVKEFNVYLSNKGEQGAPLDYVIQADVPVGHVHTNERECVLYKYPVTGQRF